MTVREIIKKFEDENTALKEEVKSLKEQLKEMTLAKKKAEQEYAELCLQKELEKPESNPNVLFVVSEPSNEEEETPVTVTPSRRSRRRNVEPEEEL